MELRSIKISFYQALLLLTLIIASGCFDRAESTAFGATGPISGREYDATAVGGLLRDLTDTQSRIKFTHQGIDVVEAHTSRFGSDAAN